MTPGIDWFGTVRGRVGYLITDQVLLYGTGGLAYGRVEVSGVTNVSGSVNTNVGSGLPPVIPFTSGANAFGDSRTNFGFAVGAGIEGKISYRTGWTWKLEYLYLDLGSLNTAGPFPGGSSPFGSVTLLTTPFTGAITTHTHFTDNIVRVGLNYQFH
jgi:outer membrane immunogenic protein